MGSATICWMTKRGTRMRPLRRYLLRFVIIERNAVFFLSFFFRESKKKRNWKMQFIHFYCEQKKGGNGCMCAHSCAAISFVVHSSRSNVSKHARLHVKVSVRLFINNSFAHKIYYIKLSGNGARPPPPHSIFSHTERWIPKTNEMNFYRAVRLNFAEVM